MSVVHPTTSGVAPRKSSKGASIFVKLLALIVSLVLGVAALLASYLSSRQVQDMQSELETKAATYGRLTSKQVESAVAFDDRETAREVFDSVHLYGELHRFVPVLAHAYGYRIGEIEVTHHPRRFGHSKYGARRFLRGLLDLFSVVTVTRYAHKPGHLFGAGGLALGACGTLILAWLSVEWLLGHAIGQRRRCLGRLLANV